MPSRKSGSCTTRRKHSLGNLRRAHPASGATWNVQVVRGKMSSKCLWHACRALILGLTLMFLGAGMATIGYYADQLSVASEIRGNATVRVKNESKGFHLNNLSYVGPIVMGFGGFIVVASCVMTFEARDSAAKVVPARLKATVTSKTTVRSNQSSGASQRRAAGIQHQATRWDHHLGVFRSSPAEPPTQPPPLDRQALTAALVHFSKSISTSARFSPKLRRLSHTGSVPNLSTLVPHPYANSTNISHLLSPNRKPLYLMQKRHRHHRHHHPHSSTNNNGRHVKSRGTRISSSLVQRTTRESATSLLQPLPPAHRLYWHALSIDESGRISEAQANRIGDRTKRSDTAKRHVLARQKPIEQHDEEKRGESSPLGNRRSSTFSDSSYSGRWTYRCASITSRASSIDSRKIHVDMHSPEALPKSILRSPKRFSSGPSTTPSVEREFRSQLSVCSEPPAPMRQLSGQSSYEPCVPEEDGTDFEEKYTTTTTNEQSMNNTIPTDIIPISTDANGKSRKIRPDTLPLNIDPTNMDNAKRSFEINKLLHRSNSSRTFYRNKIRKALEHDDSIFYTKSSEQQLANCSNESYDSLQVINERRHKLLKTESETALIERKTNFDYSGIQNVAATLLDTTSISKPSRKLDIDMMETSPKGDATVQQSCENVALSMESPDVGVVGNDGNESNESKL